MKKIVFCLFLNFYGYISAQDLQESNVFLEFGGNSGTYAINYEHAIKEYNNSLLLGRLGVSYWKNNQHNATTSIPLSVNYVTHKTSKHHMDFGLGISYFDGIPQVDYGTDDWHSFKELFLVPSIGYRYDPLFSKGFNFRFSYTPLISLFAFDDIDRNIYESVERAIYFGVMFGYRF